MSTPGSNCLCPRCNDRLTPRTDSHPGGITLICRSCGHATESGPDVIDTRMTGLQKPQLGNTRGRCLRSTARTYTGQAAHAWSRCTRVAPHFHQTRRQKSVAES